VIVPCIVVITALLLVLTAYVHNRVWFRSAGYEAALIGNGRYAAVGEELAQARAAADQRANERAADLPFTGTTPDHTVDCSGHQTKVGYSGQHFPMFDNLFGWNEEVTVIKVRPVPILRAARAVKGIAGELQDQ